MFVYRDCDEFNSIKTCSSFLVVNYKNSILSLRLQAVVELAVEAGIPREVVGLVTCDRKNVADVGMVCSSLCLISY